MQSYNANAILWGALGKEICESSRRSYRAALTTLCRRTEGALLHRPAWYCHWARAPHYPMASLQEVPMALAYSRQHRRPCLYVSFE